MDRIRKKKIEKAKEALAELGDRPKEIKIEQAVDAVTFVYAGEKSQTLPTDGSTVKLKGGVMSKASAEWVDQQLVVRGETERGRTRSDLRVGE